MAGITKRATRLSVSRARTVVEGWADRTAAWHQAPVHVGRDDIRLMLRVTSPRRAADKLKFRAGLD